MISGRFLHKNKTKKKYLFITWFRPFFVYLPFHLTLDSRRLLTKCVCDVIGRVQSHGRIILGVDHVGHRYLGLAKRLGRSVVAAANSTWLLWTNVLLVKRIQQKSSVSLVS